MSCQTVSNSNARGVPSEVPIKEAPAASACGCGCDGDRAQDNAPPAGRSLDIELLYLDREVCEPCRGAEASLDKAVAQASGILEATGVSVVVRKTHVTTEEEARRLGFVSSPTIRVQGRDVQAEVRESHCATCSALSGSDVTCRTWSFGGDTYSTPPRALLLDAILRAAYAAPPPETERHTAEVPENLRQFFAGRAS